MKVWTVRDGDGGTVGAILEKLGETVDAARDGRVFVGRVRVTDIRHKVCVGDEVRVATPRGDRLGTIGSGLHAPIVVLSTADDVVAVIKPAGIPTIADRFGSAHCLVAMVAHQLGVDESKLHPTSRLDRDVSGVVLIAASKVARERLQAARESGAYERRYVAVAHGVPDAEAGTWNAPIGVAKDARFRMVGGKNPVLAETRYALVERAGDVSVLALKPVTGRTHQLRVHAAHARCPLVGDKVYGPKGNMVLPSGRVLSLARVCLHAARIAVPSSSGKEHVYEAPMPVDIGGALSQLGLREGSWEKAVTCEV